MHLPLIAAILVLAGQDCQSGFAFADDSGFPYDWRMAWVDVPATGPESRTILHAVCRVAPLLVWHPVRGFPCTHVPLQAPEKPRKGPQKARTPKVDPVFRPAVRSAPVGAARKGGRAGSRGRLGRLAPGCEGTEKTSSLILCCRRVAPGKTRPRQDSQGANLDSHFAMPAVPGSGGNIFRGAGCRGFPLFPGFLVPSVAVPWVSAGPRAPVTPSQRHKGTGGRVLLCHRVTGARGCKGTRVRVCGLRSHGAPLPLATWCPY